MATILVVDDRADNRKFLVTLLGYGGHQLVEAGDGVQALAAARARRPDLIITDLLMPEMDGFELVRQLRTEPDLASVRVIFYTATYLESDARDLAESCGVKHILTKPAEPELILDLVGAVLQEGGTVAPPAPSLKEFQSEHLRLLNMTLAQKAEVVVPRLKAIIELSVQLASELDPSRLLETSCGGIRRVLDADYTVAGLVRKAHPQDRVLFSSGLDPSIAEGLPASGKANGRLSQLVLDRRPFRTTYDGEQVGIAIGVPSGGACLGVPIHSLGALYGWLLLGRRPGVEGFSDEEEQLAAILGGLVGRIYENGSLYSAAMQHAEDLARSQERFQQLAENIPDVFWVAEVEPFKIVYVSPAYEAVWGRSATELYERSSAWMEAVVTEDRPLAQSFLERTLRGESTSREFRISRPDGAVRWIWLQGFPVRPAADRLERVTGIAVDITERKRSERRLAMQHAVTQVLAESPSLGAAASRVIQAVCEPLGAQFGALWEIDRQRNALRCAQLWRAPGLSAPSLEIETREIALGPGMGLPGRVWATGKPLVVSHVGRDGNFPCAESAMAAGLSSAFAFPILVRSEVAAVIDLLGPGALEPGPELLAALQSVGSQIGQFIEHRRAEQQLIQAQKMEAVGQLAGGIAHDFNNLLGVILGYAQLASRELAPDHKVQRRLEAVCKGAERAAALTRQILTFSRKEAFETRICDLNAIVENMERMLGRLIGEDVRLVVALGPDLGRVRADPGQIEQVIMNLAVNARDAMPSGGRLIIETANADLDRSYADRHPEVGPGPHVMLAVSDTGAGMSPGTVTRIFEPFFTTKDPGKGTGLGLAVVFGVVRQSRGSISVYSELGHGTTFKIFLPRVDETEGEDPTAGPQAAAVGGSETVLLVEDEEALRSIVAETLREAGYVVLEAADHTAAVAMAARAAPPIDLLLTDVIMPGRSGPDVAALVANLRPGIRVLLMSGYTDRQISGKPLIEPGTPFLGKPFTRDALLRKVRDVLDLNHPGG